MEKKLLQGNNLELLKTLESNSIDSVVTDPPYGLSFMNKKWDYDVPSVEFWKEVYRVLKPGGHILSFGGTRTAHRLTIRIEDAGFEIRDQIQWIYGMGFPKSLNVKKQLEKNGYKICECSEQNTEHNLRPLSEANISQTINPENKQRQALLQDLYEPNIQGAFQGDIKGSESKESNERREKSSLEGWSNSIQEKGQLQGDNIQESTRTSKNNGEERWIHNGTQNDNGSNGEQIINENRSSSSYRPQPQQQPSEQSATMADKCRPQESGSGKICSGCGKQIIDLTLGHTALKPANEPICLARKPISENTIAQNVLKWGTGGINIDGCRVGYVNEKINFDRPRLREKKDWVYDLGITWENPDVKEYNQEGRFPANIILECICDEVIKGDKAEVKRIYSDGGNQEDRRFGGGKGLGACETNAYNDKGDIHTDPNCPCYIMDKQSGESKGKVGMTQYSSPNNIYNGYKSKSNTKTNDGITDKGGASRFFYQAKVSKSERNIHNPNCPCYIMDKQSGVSKSSDYKYDGKNTNTKFGQIKSSKRERGFTDKGGASRFFYQAKVSKAERNMGLDLVEAKEVIRQELAGENNNPIHKNNHPTVKPINLMTYLCRLITPKGGTILDAYMGSGSTGIAALLEGFNFIGMEMDEDYFKIASSRINNYEQYRKFIK